MSGQWRPKTFQRVAAKHAIARVIGVRGITDEVVISREQLSNEVGAEVSAALARNRLLENAALRVSSLGRTIYLDGTVGSYTAKRTALYIARCAPGVAAVIDRTTVHGKSAFVPCLIPSMEVWRKKLPLTGTSWPPKYRRNGRDRKRETSYYRLLVAVAACDPGTCRRLQAWRPGRVRVHEEETSVALREPGSHLPNHDLSTLRPASSGRQLP